MMTSFEHSVPVIAIDHVNHYFGRGQLRQTNSI